MIFTCKSVHMLSKYDSHVLYTRQRFIDAALAPASAKPPTSKPWDVSDHFQYKMYHVYHNIRHFSYKVHHIYHTIHDF